MSVAGSSASITGGGGADYARTSPVLNAVTAFAAHFHVRRGNEIIWAAGLHSVEQLSKQGLEWKVLPSGSHLLERDVIFFDVEQDSVGGEHGHLVGVAAFKNRKIGDEDRTGAGDEDDDQRGARMMAVGAIVDCGAHRTPWTQLAATLPHTCQLEKLVDALSADPSCRNILQEWLDMHHRKGAFVQSPNRQVNLDGLFYPHDPLLMLPAISNALGPFLPCLIKSLLTAPFRLLLFVPPGSQSLQVASIAFNLAELVYTACQSPSKSGLDRCPIPSVHADAMKIQHGLEVKGLVGLHDVDRLKATSTQRDAQGWIAYTSDRILLEKLQLYDGLLDLSPMMHLNDPGSGLIDATSLPRFKRTESLTGKDGRVTMTAHKQSWTTREFAVYRGLDERASVDAGSARQLRRMLGRKRGSSGSHITTTSVNETNEVRSSAIRYSPVRRPSTSTMLAFITFWLSSLRFLPQRWRLNLRESYGYVPLSIRSDGGIRASIMLLPTSDEEDDDDYMDGEEAEGSQLGAYLGVPSASPQMGRPRSHSNALSVDEEARQDSDIVNDPILAAVGAGSFAHRRRHSRSVSSNHRSAAQVASDVANVHARDGRPISPELPLQHGSVFKEDDEEEAREALRDARESVRLALSLHAAWSAWVEDLVVSIQATVQDSIPEEEIGTTEDNHHTDEAATTNRSEAAQLLKHQETAALTVTSSQMTQIGLSSTNAIDVNLVQFLASTVTDRSVDVQRGWSILSWLCW